VQDFAEIIKEALEAKSDDFIRLVEDVRRLLCSENGRVGKLNVIGRLAKVEPVREAVIISDLHGDLESLIDILKQSKILQRIDQSKDSMLIFLGDYGDRGEYSKEVYYTALKLKQLFPEQVVLMRGNHEAPRDIMASPHDLPIEFQMKFGDKWEEAYSKICDLFECLYHAILVEERYLIIHGGLPSQARTIDDLAYAHNLHPKQSNLEEMLWSDPDETIKETCVSPRGAGKLFGENVTKQVLRRFNVEILIRGHESCSEGFKIDHNGKVLTLFSRKGPPYFNAYGAYLDLNLSEKFKNAEQLIPSIHRF
jgi:protein phosphatase